MIPTLTTPIASAILQSTKCPACGRLKPAGATLCRQHYIRLTAELKNLLASTRLGAGLEAAIGSALRQLGAKTLHVDLPTERVTDAAWRPSAPAVSGHTRASVPSSAGGSCA